MGDSFCAADFGDAVLISLRREIFSRLVQSGSATLRGTAQTGLTEWWGRSSDAPLQPPGLRTGLQRRLQHWPCGNVFLDEHHFLTEGREKNLKNI